VEDASLGSGKTERGSVIMPTTNGVASHPRNRNPRAFSYSFDPQDERRRDTLLRDAFMLIVAPFKSRPEPRGPWDETATRDITPWSYPLGLMRNAMATAIVSGDRNQIEQVLGGVRAFCRELEADITSMVPATEEESIVTVALEEIHVEGQANESQAALIAHPSPTTAESAIIPLERHYERIGKLIRKCRRVARETPSLAGHLR
jgi:hypothetical protein